jgi:hypothetical protein
MSVSLSSHLALEHVTLLKDDMQPLYSQSRGADTIMVSWPIAWVEMQLGCFGFCSFTHGNIPLFFQLAYLLTTVAGNFARLDGVKPFLIQVLL